MTVFNKLRSTSHIDLGENILNMVAHRSHGQAELLANIFSRIGLQNVKNNLPFAWTEQFGGWREYKGRRNLYLIQLREQQRVTGLP